MRRVRSRCGRKVVHGSFIAAAFFTARTTTDKLVRVAYLADAPSRAQLTISEAAAGKQEPLLFDAAIKRELTVSIKMRHRRVFAASIAVRRLSACATASSS